MRVLVITPKILDESLSASVRLNIYNTMAEHAEVHVIARLRNPKAWSAETQWSASYIAAPTTPGLSMAYFALVAPFKAIAALRRHRSQVIFVERGAMFIALAARFVARLQGRRSAVCLDIRTLPMEAQTLRAAIDRVVDPYTLRYAGRHCELLTAITPGAARWLAPLAGVPVASIPTFSTGVDAEMYDPAKHPAAVRETDAPTSFLYHGVIYTLRGLDTLVEACGILRDRGRRDFRVTLLGSGPDVGSLAEQVAAADLSQVISLPGAVAQSAVPDEIAAHDFGIVPLPDLACWNTSSPTKLFELMSMQKPVVLSRIEAHTAVLGDEPYVVWAEPSDAESLADAMADAIDRRDELGSAARSARDRVLREFTWDRQVGVLLEALGRIVPEDS